MKKRDWRRHVAPLTATIMALTTLMLANPTPANATWTGKAGCIEPWHRYRLHSDFLTIAWLKLGLKVCWGTHGHLTSVSERWSDADATSWALIGLTTVDIDRPASLGGFTPGQNSDVIRAYGRARRCRIYQITGCDPAQTFSIQIRVVAPAKLSGPLITRPSVSYASKCTNSWCWLAFNVNP